MAGAAIRLLSRRSSPVVWTGATRYCIVCRRTCSGRCSQCRMLPLVCSPAHADVTTSLRCCVSYTGWPVQRASAVTHQPSACVNRYSSTHHTQSWSSSSTTTTTLHWLLYEAYNSRPHAWFWETIDIVSILLFSRCTNVTQLTKYPGTRVFFWTG